MLDHLEFVSKEKSMLIAPAGYGKTHTITECLNHTQEHGKQLILTHTHAGVASIKEKMKKMGIPSSIFHIETISSFAQKYVLAFYIGRDIPEQGDNKEYYSFILGIAIKLFKLEPIKRITSTTYKGLFVDEYQDCTKEQHELILQVSNLFPTHILGDPLQGIFGFNGEELVDMNDDKQMRDFATSRYNLDIPQRWLRGNNSLLGENLKNIRNQLLKSYEINLLEYKDIETYLISEIDLYNPTKDYNKKIRKLLDERSLLLLHPDSTSINPRLKIIKLFNNGFNLVEAIDDKDFYKLSKMADLIAKEDVMIGIINLCKVLFNKSGFANWFNTKGFKKKKHDEDKILILHIENKIKELAICLSFSLLADVLKGIINLPDMKCYRRELFNSFCKALQEADYNNISVNEAMINKRNIIRRSGRKIFGRCIGTTLLTKGLEFDTVAILNAHKYDSPKHLYVALTRASKRLIVFTENATLNPY